MLLHSRHYDKFFLSYHGKAIQRKLTVPTFKKTIAQYVYEKK